MRALIELRTIISEKKEELKKQDKSWIFTGNISEDDEHYLFSFTNDNLGSDIVYLVEKNSKTILELNPLEAKRETLRKMAKMKPLKYEDANDFIIYDEMGFISKYIGVDGDKLFTRDEVSNILRNRIQMLNDIMCKEAGVKSTDELIKSAKEYQREHLVKDNRLDIVKIDDLLNNIIPHLYKKGGYKEKKWMISDYILESDLIFIVSFQNRQVDANDGISFIVNKKTGEIKENALETVTPEEELSVKEPVNLTAEQIKQLETVQGFKYK